MSNRRILLSVPHMGGGERKYIDEAFQSNWLSTVGPNLDAFEYSLEQRIGLPCVALSSGTAAIHLGLRLLGVRPGDEVFCPTLTFTATCNPVRYLGATPVFLDSERATWNLDPNVLETALRDRARAGKLPRALVVVHLYGQCADMEPIVELCRRYEIPLLEDAAQALGATYDGREAGTFGEVSAFSFNGNKIITTTGGGVLAARDAAWVGKARFWSQQARDPSLAYEHSELGYNYRMSNVLAGIGRGQLEVLDLRIRQRRAIAARYRAGFADLQGITPMPEAPRGRTTNWLSAFVVDEATFGCSRDALIASLDAANVESRPVWKPMHLQPLFEGCACYGGAVAEDLFLRGVCLPSSSSLSAEEQLHVINAVRGTVGAGALPQIPEQSTGDSQAGGLEGELRGPIEIRGPGVAAQGADAVLIADLLGREPAQLSAPDMGRNTEGKTVLVTGAAGSIGTELCRQLARHGPAAIIAFDVDESGLFDTEMAFRKAFPETRYYAELGSVQNAARVEELMRRYRPEVIYHAAAYKHVPMLESHAIEAVENNVLGTWAIARAAAQYGAHEFVLISSDKAVRPTSVMGATKRIAEMILQSLKRSATSYVIVRFGNVLGSRASVVPIFEQQIADGGPVTVTHPEMRRFFMTIQEACQLIVVTAGMGGDGQIYALDMGEPIRIADLARRMIARAGAGAAEIRIEYTGMRPGEKLTEELWEACEQSVATRVEGIRALAREHEGTADLLQSLEDLRESCARRDTPQVLAIMQELIPQFEYGEALTGQAGGGTEGANSTDAAGVRAAGTEANDSGPRG